MRDCPDAGMRDRLPDLVHEQLAPVERQALLAHLAQCADCSAELSLLSELRGSRPVAEVDVSRIVAALPRPSAARATVREVALRPTVRAGVSGRWRAAAAIVMVSAGALAIGTARMDRGSPVQQHVDTTRIRPSAAAAPRVAGAAAGMSLGTPLTDVSESELQVLLGELESLEALTPGEPALGSEELLAEGGIS